MTETEGRELVKRRQNWLKKKKMAVREFADSTELDYNSVVRWFTAPRRPHRLYAERVLSVFKDFPLR